MSESGDLDTAIKNCFAAFDDEFKATFSRVYASSLSAIGKSAPENLGDIEAVLPSQNKGDKPKGDPQAKSKKKKGVSATLPIDGTLTYKGEQVKPEKAYNALSDALNEALKNKNLGVHVQDWGVVNMDVEPHVFVQICSTLGDFEAVTYKTIDDFNKLHEILSKNEE